MPTKIGKKIEESDVLVIGSGIAGATAAILAAEIGLKVNLITKEENLFESATFYAQGGIAGLGKNDSSELLAQDIIKAGAGLVNRRAVEIVAKVGPGLIKSLLIDKFKVKFTPYRSSSPRPELGTKAGAGFTQAGKGQFSLTREAAHSRRRIYYAGDSTGEAIQESLVRFLKKLQKKRTIRLDISHQAIDLITLHHFLKGRIYEENRCLGAYVLDLRQGKVKTFLAKVVVLATGGLGQIYLNTSNPSCATGDGAAMAHRAGAQIINAEFIQFHPTVFYLEKGPTFLVSEALRGEGARLKNIHGKTFMQKYHSQRDLAPRDVVSRGIHQEMQKTESRYVYLDLASYRSKSFIKKRFPHIYSQCEEHGYDLTSQKIPVVPAAHYFCGGLKVDQWGHTSLKNLYAIGEVSCTGVHGANRLASISLLEGLTWAVRAAYNINSYLKNEYRFKKERIPLWQMKGVTEEPDNVLIQQDWLSIKNIMWNYVGVIRTTRFLERACADLSYLRHRIEKFYKINFLTKELIELRNGIEVASLVAQRALQNEKSLGCHYRK